MYTAIKKQAKLTIRKRNPRSEKEHRGYPGLLNLDAQPHWTVIISDFTLPATDVDRLQRQLRKHPTRLFFCNVEDGTDPLLELLTAGLDVQNDYVSIQGVISRHENFQVLQQLFEKVRRRDLTRLELPMVQCGFKPTFASELLRVVSEADYVEQDDISERFFRLLAGRKPYQVTINTSDCSLDISDETSWFDIAGRLRDGETRIIPAGEVAYTGDRADGEFVIDGAVLPLAEDPDVAEEANELLPLSREVGANPIRLRIRQGQVVDLSGNRMASKLLSRLFETDDRYCRVTEVGISFNRACHTFIHDWPAASNESRPGVHLGLGGDPVDTDQRSQPLVHIDCMAANSEVFVNSHPFLRSSS